MRKILSLMLPPFLLAACNLPHNNGGVGTVSVTDTPTNQPCYFNWATQPLPDLSAQIQAAADATGLENAIFNAEAFGENCYDPQTNEPISFGAIETDFRITVKVADLTDKDNLGNLLEQVLAVLDGFPSDTTPGPQPGYVEVAFQSPGDELNLWFTIAEGKSARAEGLQGAALLDKLLNQQ